MKRLLEYIFHNFFYKLLSLLLAFLIWFLVQEEERQRPFYRDERIERSGK